ncbi:hypothetical protein M0638_12945 [Roseomonas sp. NAR14]|uniref:Uncharacterized protein n=1 Tax=Roseomonas acroporae TaxID=2937791 RepID=A0A9X2BUA1_9PROT|nr:hypothetical protein [Roseomonas acroporae]MCK8785292.1 hypothetical protein [Roseomonas acroporae]
MLCCLFALLAAATGLVAPAARRARPAPPGCGRHRAAGCPPRERPTLGWRPGRAAAGRRAGPGALAVLVLALAALPSLLPRPFRPPLPWADAAALPPLPICGLLGHGATP